MRRTHLVAVTLLLLASAGVQTAQALIPPMQAACYLPENQGCRLLNSYDCDTNHGNWHPGEACPPAHPAAG